MASIFSDGSALTLVNAASLVSMLNGARGSMNLVRRALPPPRDRTPWHALDVRAVQQRLGTGPGGLERKQAILRRRPEVGRGTGPRTGGSCRGSRGCPRP